MKGAVDMNKLEWACYACFTPRYYRGISIFFAVLCSAAGVLASVGFGVWGAMIMPYLLFLVMGMTDFLVFAGSTERNSGDMNFIRSSGYGMSYMRNVYKTDIIFKTVLNVFGTLGSIVYCFILGPVQGLYALMCCELLLVILMLTLVTTRRKVMTLNAQTPYFYAGSIALLLCDGAMVFLILKFGNDRFSWVLPLILDIVFGELTVWACLRLYRESNRGFESGYRPNENVV